jgi:hypothetical protein
MFSSPNDCDVVGLMTADSAPLFLFSLTAVLSAALLAISGFPDFEACVSRSKELCPIGCPAAGD